MSLLKCIDDLGVSTFMTKEMVDKWNSYTAQGLDEYTADRKILAEYSKELTGRLNSLEKTLGLQKSSWISTARRPKEINASFDMQLKEIKPNVTVIPAEMEEVVMPEEFNGTREGMLRLDLEMAQDGTETNEPGGNKPPISLVEFVQHSGGAEGADIEWDRIGKEFGVVTNRHYWAETKTPYGKPEDEISSTDMAEGKVKATAAARATYGFNGKSIVNSLLVRNWAQVKYADSIFAIGTIAQTGQRLFPNIPNDTRLALKPAVTGGTGYAVEMGIQAGKPVFVFDQPSGKWHMWDTNVQNFVPLDAAPVLTQNFAGIGTRNISDAGKQAIREVFQATVKAIDDGTYAPVESGPGVAEESVIPTIDTTLKTYQGKVTALKENQVFVFGANHMGYHGQGSAGAAMGQERSLKEVAELAQKSPGFKGKWAVLGEHSKISSGTEGKSYGLVTVEGKIEKKNSFNRLDKNVILDRVKALYELAATMPATEFLIGYTGEDPNFKNNNGYTAREMAEIFASFPVPENIVFEENFAMLIEGTPVRFLGVDWVIQDQGGRHPLFVSEEDLDAIRKSQLIEIRNADGKGTGKFFTSHQQLQATDSILYQVKRLADVMLKERKAVKTVELKNAVKTYFENLQNKLYTVKARGLPVPAAGMADIAPHITTEMGIAYRDNMEMVLNSFDPLFNATLDKLNLLGIKLEDMSRDGREGKDPNDLTVVAGKGLENYNDKVAMLNPQDSASGRLKMYIATTEAVTIGKRPTPKPVTVPLREGYREAVVRGEKTATFRTPAQLQEMRLHLRDGYDRGLVNFKNALGEDRFFVVIAKDRMSPQEAIEFNNSVNKEEVEAKEGDILVEFQPFVESEETLIFTPSFIGTPALADFESLFQDVTGLLADRKPSLEEYIQVLEGSNKLPLRRLAERLKSHRTTTEQERREFVTVMTKSYTQHGLVQFGMKYGAYEVSTFNANNYSAKKVVIRNWKEAQKVSPIMTRDVSGNFEFNPDIIEELRKDYEELKGTFALYETLAKGTEKQKTLGIWRNKQAALAKKMLEYNGIVIPKEAFEDFFKWTKQYTKGTKFGEGDLFKQWKVNKDGSPAGIFSAFMESLLGNGNIDIINEKSIERNNPLYQETQVMTFLSGLYARFSDNLYNSSHRNINGDTIWDYTLNTYLNKTFKSLLADESPVRDQLKKAHYSKNNWLLHVWQNQPDVRGMGELYFLEGLRKKKSKKANERDGMSDREQLFMAVNAFANSGRKFMNHVGLTHSDKTTTPLYMNMPRTPTINDAGNFHSTMRDRLYSVFEGEFDRIAATATTNSGSVQFEKGKGLFYLLPQFNYATLSKLVGKKLIDGTVFTDEDLALIWMTPDQLNTAAKASQSTIDVVSKLLYQFAASEAMRTYEKFKELGLVTAEGHMFDLNYVRKMVEPALKLRNPAKNVYKEGNKAIPKDVYMSKIAYQVALDYAMNSFLMNASLVQLVTGDPAQVFKDNLETTLIEYEKRLAGNIAPGKETEWAKPTYQAITLADYVMDVKYLSNINKVYTKAEIADGQEFITVEEHIETMFRYGLIAEDLYKEMLAVIVNGEDYEFTKKEHLDVIMQISKPVYYGSRQEANGVILHDYVKSSALPLYPPMTRNTELDKLRKAMEQKGIARAHFRSARKIGYPVPSKTFDADGKYIGIDDGAIMQMDRSGLRIQQEVPYDEDKHLIQIFTQANKLITADLPADINITFPDGRTFTRESIRKLKEDLRIKMIDEHIGELMTELGVKRVRNELGNLVFEFTDKKKFIDKLIEEAKGKNYSPNEMAPIIHLKNGQPTSPIYFSSLAEPMHNLMMSMVDKAIKIKVTGKSYVQASSVGITKLVNDGSIPDGVKWLHGHDGERLHHMRKHGDMVFPAEILVPFNFFVGGKKLSLKSFMKEDGVTLDMEKLPEEVLQMVGVRIPTSKQNSMLPMIIVGFLPENMGDTIIVPEGITVQMGSDFDVDKLFVYQRPYNMSAAGLRVNPGTEEDYFQVHWSILTNPKMFEAVTSPLDKNDLKDEAALIGVKPGKGNFFGGINQLADFSSQKDAKGLVGFTALMNTFMAGVQPLDLRLATLIQEEGSALLSEVATPISTFGIDLVNLSGYGTSLIKNSAGEFERRTKMDNINIILSEVLDHAKHRTIDKINLTMHTFPALSALMSLESKDGQALNLQYGTRLLMQEYVRKYSARMAQGEDILSGYVADLQGTTFEALLGELIQLGAVPEAAAEMKFNEEQLKDLLTKQDTPEYYTAQYALLTAFQKLTEVGRRMSEMAAMTNQDVNGTDGNLFTVLDKMEKRNTILGDNVIFGGDAILSGVDGKGTEKGMIFDNVTGMASTLFKDYLPHEDFFKTILQEIKETTGRTSMTQVSLDIKKDVFKAFRSYIYSGIPSLGITDPGAERARLLYHTEKGPSLAERVLEAQSTWGQSNHLIRRLIINIESYNEPHTIQYVAAKLTRMDDQENVKAWAELLQDPDPAKKLLGEDLIRYAFLTGGIQDASSIVRYVPFGYMLSIGWFDELTKVYEQFTSRLANPEFTDQWFRHNPERAIQITEGFEDITGRKIEGVPETFVTVPINEIDPRPVGFEKYRVAHSSINGKKMPAPYLSYRDSAGNTILYRKATPGNGDGVNGVRYFRIDTLGDAITDEYNAITAQPRSIITENRAFNKVWRGEPLPIPSRGNPFGLLTPAINEPEPVTSTTVHPEWAKLGIKDATTSGETLFETVFPALLKSGAIPGEHASVIEMLMAAKSNPFIEAVLKKVNKKDFTIRDVQVKLFEGNMSANYNVNSHIVFLPNDESALARYKRGGVTPSELLAHEMVHSTTWPLIELFAKSFTDPKLTEMIVTEAGKYGTNATNLIETTKKLNDLYEVVKEYVANDAGRIMGGDPYAEYGLSSLHEFIAVGLTYRPFQKILNEIQAPNSNKSVFQKFLEFMGNILSYLAPGIDVNPDSVLMEFLPLATIITTNNNSKLMLYSTDVFKYNGTDVVIGVDEQGIGREVSHGFMFGEPEPARQSEISRILSEYNKNKDVDPVTKKPFRGTLIIEPAPKVATPPTEPELPGEEPVDDLPWDTDEGLPGVTDDTPPVLPPGSVTEPSAIKVGIQIGQSYKAYFDGRDENYTAIKILSIDGNVVTMEVDGMEATASLEELLEMQDVGELLTYDEAVQPKPEPPKGLGKYELFPGVFANEAQRKAIDVIPAFIEDMLTKRRSTSFEDRSFLLSGAGGTGKTTIIKKIIEQFPDKTIAFAAPSHNAVVELKGALGPKMSKYVNTLQSEVRMIRDNKESYKQQRDVFVQSPGESGEPKRVEYADIIVVDESSMLDDQIMGYLQTSTEGNAPIIIFMGDYAQLPPINQGEDSWPMRKLKDDKAIVLTENMRTNKADISSFLIRTRQQVDAARAGDLSAYRLPIVPFKERVQSENVTLISDGSKREFYDAYVKAFKLETGNPKNAIMVAYRNQARLAANTAIRVRLFGELANTEKFTKGDLIIFNSGKALKAEHAKVMEKYFSTPNIFNMQRAFVESYREAEDTIRISVGTGRYMKYYNVTANMAYFTIDLGVEAENNKVAVSGLTKEAADKIIGEVKARPYANGGYDITGTAAAKIIGNNFVRYGEWIDFATALTGEVIDVDYAYAVTSHKSQGSTYNHVFVDEMDIAGVTLASDKDKVHSFYTAVSRTREHLYILHPANPKTAPVRLNASLNALSATVANGSNGPWTYKTREEAERMAEVGSALFEGIKLEARANTLHAAPTAQIAKKVELTVERLTKHMEVIRESMTHDLDKKSMAQKRQELDRIEADIVELKKQDNLEAIHKVGERQMAWAEQIMTQKSPGATDIMTAWKVANTWANIIDILYNKASGDTLDARLSAVSGRAKHLQKKLMEDKVVPAMISVSENRLRPVDFTAGLEDMTGFAANALSLNRASAQLTQEIDLVLKNAARRRDAEIQKHTKQMEDLDARVSKYAAAHGMTKQQVFDQLIQSSPNNDVFGLVQRFSPGWFTKIGQLRSSRIKSIRAINKSKNPSKGPAVAAQWKHYWTQVRNIGVFANVRSLFDPKTGVLLTTPAAKAEQARLLTELQDQAVVDELIRETEKRYADYLDTKESNDQDIAARLAQGQITAAEANQERMDFVDKYSPEIFTDALNAPPNVAFSKANEGDRYVPMYPKAKFKQFYDAQYNVIQKDKELTAFYNEIKTTLNTLKKSLPLYVQWDMYENFLPVVLKHLLHDMNAKEYVQTMGERFLDGITGTKFEEDRKESEKIPIQFTFKDKDEVSNYSRDLVRIIEMFGSMALHYKHFSQVKDVVDMGETYIKEMDRMRRANDVPGAVLGNTVKALAYAKSYLMYKNPRKLEGDTGAKIYSLNPLKQFETAQKVKKLLAERYTLEQELLNPTGAKSRQDIKDEIEDIDKKLSAIEGRNLYLSKVGDRLIGFNQLKALAFNPFSGFANWAFGMVSMHVYAAGGRDFTTHDLGVAWKIMNSSTAKWLTFGEYKNTTAEKIMNLMDKTGMLGDIVDTQYGETNLSSRQSRLKRNLDPFTMLRSSDYYTKATVMVATMLHTKITVQENGVDKEVSIWEAFDEKGEWKYDPKAGWTDDNIAKQGDWEKFRNRTLRIGQIVMGNMDKNSPKLMNKFILGRLIGQFRASWLPEGWAARFEDEKFDVQLDRTIKGRYRTYIDLGIGGSLTVLLRQFAGMFSKVDPFTGIQVNGAPLTTSEVDMENMKRNFTGLAWTLSMMAGIIAIKMLMSSGDDDDDSITQESLMIVLNLMNRVNQDMQFYSSPDVANNLIRNAIPAFDVITDYGKAISAVEKAIRSEDYTWDQAALRFTKATPFLNQINRIKYMMNHDISTISR